MISHYYYNHNPQLPAMKKLLLPLKTSSAIKNPSQRRPPSPVSFFFSSSFPNLQSHYHHYSGGVAALTTKSLPLQHFLWGW